MRISDWSSGVCSSDRPALFLDEYLADRSARRDADEAMFAEVPEREARRGFGHVGFAIEDDQLALAEPAAADRGVLRHLDRDRDVGFALVELADQIVVVDGLQVEIDVGMTGEKARNGFGKDAESQRRESRDAQLNDRGSKQLNS